MICPHCLKTIEDGASFCPTATPMWVRAMVPSTPSSCSARAAVPVFLRMIVRAPMRRPAPGILSEDAAASDLAAGRTAGFPRLTQEQIDTEVPHAPASAAAVLSDAADPNETCVLPAFDRDFGIPKVDIPTPVSLHDDAQKPKRKVHPRRGRLSQAQASYPNRLSSSRSLLSFAAVPIGS